MRLNDFSVKMAILDLAIVNCIHMFLLMLSLNFQWKTSVLSRSDLSSSSQQKSQSKGLFKAKNSIALHNLRLSNADRQAIERRSQVSSMVDGAENLKNHFQLEKIRLEKKDDPRKEDSSINRRDEATIEALVIREEEWYEKSDVPQHKS